MTFSKAEGSLCLKLLIFAPLERAPALHVGGHQKIYRKSAALRGRRTYDNRRMVQSIADDEAAFADKRRDDGAVGCKSHAEDDGGGFA